MKKNWNLKENPAEVKIYSGHATIIEAALEAECYPVIQNFNECN